MEFAAERKFSHTLAIVDFYPSRLDCSHEADNSHGKKSCVLATFLALVCLQHESARMHLYPSDTGLRNRCRSGISKLHLMRDKVFACTMDREQGKICTLAIRP